MSARDARGRFAPSGAPGSAADGSGSDGDDGSADPTGPQGGATDAKPARVPGVRARGPFTSGGAGGSAADDGSDGAGAFLLWLKSFLSSTHLAGFYCMMP